MLLPPAMSFGKGWERSTFGSGKTVAMIHFSHPVVSTVFYSHSNSLSGNRLKFCQEFNTEKIVELKHLAGCQLWELPSALFSMLDQEEGRHDKQLNSTHTQHRHHHHYDPHHVGYTYTTTSSLTIILHSLDMLLSPSQIIQNPVRI